MDTNNKKVIKNVAVLDLRSATEESVAAIERIENVANVLYSDETAHLITRLNIRNMALSIKAPVGARLLNGQERLSRDSFRGLDEPLDLFVNGQLMLESDVPEEDVRSGLNSLVVNGQLLYPETLAGVIKAKMIECNGQARAYADGAKIITGRLVLTESYLRGLEDNSVLLVMGQLVSTETLSNELLAQKIENVDVMGGVTCLEENAETLLPRVRSDGSTSIIPAGFTYLRQELMLDVGMLEALPGSRLYGSSLRIESDVTPDALDVAVDALVVKDLLIAPADLRSVLAQKCNLLETQSVFYTGELWLIDGETTLNASRFDYLEGKATLVVRGELFIGDDVEPAQLAQHFDKVHNFGEISCTPDQMSALQARLGRDHGEFIHPGPAGDADENVIGNAAYLAL